LLNTSKIKTVHIEASTYCNARCPQCPRNFCGWNILDFPQKHLTVAQLEPTVKQLPKTVLGLFNGNYGDPMMNPNIVALAKLFNNCSITTNGSIGKLETFLQLAQLGVQITFSIDGLKDTNHIYRQDVVWERIIERVKTFIDAGGIAHWKFVIFKHNMHQVKRADDFSKRIGFASFEVVNDERNHGPILDNTGKEVGWLLPHNRSAEPYDYDIEHELNLINNPYDLQNDYSDAIINCELKRENNIYINVDGEVLPCCYHGVDQHIYPKGTTLQEQLDSFRWLEQTWGKKDCNETCYTACKR
jgi:MoaA/NifB/PqqE/SkfB family radical SAM enzyme